ncbi:MopE-related protein [Algibacter sp. R77976]|uniref:MopE-related protein n=1 Tax=Algibacter sp. R77976 TaxID=3093873 RepID=UPI0037C6B3BD
MKRIISKITAFLLLTMLTLQVQAQIVEGTIYNLKNVATGEYLKGVSTSVYESGPLGAGGADFNFNFVAAGAGDAYWNIDSDNRGVMRGQGGARTTVHTTKAPPTADNDKVWTAVNVEDNVYQFYLKDNATMLVHWDTITSTLKLLADATDDSTKWELESQVVLEPYNGVAYNGVTPQIGVTPDTPVVIELENYDALNTDPSGDGGNFSDNTDNIPTGVAATYNDRTAGGNAAQTVRLTSDVGIKAGATGNVLTDVLPNEYTIYTVNVITAGTYHMGVNYKHGGTSKDIKVYSHKTDGTGKTLLYDSGPDGGLPKSDYVTTDNLGEFDLPAGPLLIRFRIMDNGPSFDFMTFTLKPEEIEDADGDGESADTDCDDNNPDVNSSATEILYDGIDNDCNPDTLDTEDVDGDGENSDTDCDDNNAEVNSAATEILYDGIDNDCNPETLDTQDADGDGENSDTDCDDNNAEVNSAATEILYDGIDNDCNPDTLDTEDADGDGENSDTDCDDNNAEVNSAATEILYDGIDNDCNPETLDTQDADGDGENSDTDCDDNNAEINSSATEILDNGIDDDCNPETLDSSADSDDDGDGQTENEGDCDDTDAEVNSAATEILYDGIDNDCNPDTLDTEDVDGDGENSDTDCDDNNAEVNSAATEILYDGIDNDCNPDTLDTQDADGDGENSDTDCDDNNADVNSAATEILYDGIDNDCNPDTLDTQDADGDGENSDTDCDDNNAEVNSAATEILYDGIDNDCNPETLDTQDADGDGENSDTDCDDNNAKVNSAATEILYDGIDNDCNPDTLDTQDVDGDGENSDTDCDDNNAEINSSATEILDNGIDDDCNPETLDSSADSDDDGDGQTENEGDCDDTDAEVNSAATEILYDGIDNDCNPETLDTQDADGDGENSDTDCDDNNAEVNSAATEILYDGIDNDCNPETLDTQDADGDGENSDTDCDDNNAEVNSAATEILGNGIDDDCNPDTLDTTLASYNGIAYNAVTPQIGINPGTPVLIELENYDELIGEPSGDDGANFNDNTDNIPTGVLGTYNDRTAGGSTSGTQTVRTSSDADIKAGGSGNVLTDVLPNEYTIYTINVVTAGTYHMGVNYKHGGTSKDIKVYSHKTDGTGKTLLYDSGPDGGLPKSNYVTTDNLGEFDLPAGPLLIRFRIMDNGPSFDFMTFTLKPEEIEDADGDGESADTDCDDNNPDVNSAATEILYDGIDNDCNPETLDTQDADGDGENSDTDCDDNNAEVNSAATEILYDGIDNDCNPETLDTQDADGDGENSDTDCDDNNAEVNSAATEILYDGIDNDCNPDTLDTQDADGDGENSDTDCDDNNAEVNSSAIEILDNGIDDDCNPETPDTIDYSIFVWTGTIDSDWNNTGNWASNNAPSLIPEKDVTIPNVGVNNYPLLTDNLILDEGLSLIVENNASLTMSPNTELTNHGTVINNGTITFKSDAMGSAYIGSGTGTFTGDFTVERYIPAKRAYRQLASPVTTSTPISENWQMATHITGSASGANGFDATSTGNSSMYVFDNDAYNYVQMANTNATNLDPNTMYHILVRGDRNTDLTNNNATPSVTTLRATGELTAENEGSSTIAITVPEQRFIAIGNPFQSQVDMDAVLTTNATNITPTFYWVWDPTLGYRGAYTTIIASSGMSVPADSDANQYLQAGQAGWVYTQGAGDSSLSFTQASKANSEMETEVFKTSSKNDESVGQLSLSLYESSALANNESAADGLLILFDTEGNNAVDGLDAPKITNLDENFATNNNGTLLSIENRAAPQDAEEIQLEINTYRNTNYTIVAEGIAMQGETAYLSDAYTSVLTEIPQNGTVNYAYSVDSSIEESVAGDRFKIIYAATALSVDTLDMDKILLYPNPTSIGKFYLNIPLEMDDLEVTIYNALGAKIYNKTGLTGGSKATIDTSFILNQGMYFVKLSSHGKTIMKKLNIN